MDKLDRLGWAAGLSFSSFGVRIGIRTTDASIMDQVSAGLPPGWKPIPDGPMSHLFSVVVGGAGPRSGVRKMWLLYDGWVRQARGREAEPVLDELGSAVRLKVAEYAPRRVFVHAGVVGWKGRAIVVPGRSHSGKSTLVAELLRAGATYYSDEYAVLDARGLVHPYPAPLSIRSEGGATLQEPASFGADIATKPMRIGAVAVSAYREGATWRPRSMSQSQAALAMLENTVSARRRPQNALASLRAAVGGAALVRGDRGEAAEVAQALIKLVEAS